MRKTALLLAMTFILSLLLPVVALAEEEDYSGQLTEDFYSLGMEADVNRLARNVLKVVPISERQYDMMQYYLRKAETVLKGRSKLSELSENELLSLYKIVRLACNYLYISVSYKESKTTNGYVLRVSYDGKLIGSIDTHGQSPVARTDRADSRPLLAACFMVAAFASAGYLSRKKKVV